MDLKEEASFPSELVVKADFSDAVVEFRLTKEEIKYENLLKSIKNMYKEAPTNFAIKVSAFQEKIDVAVPRQ